MYKKFLLPSFYTVTILHRVLLIISIVQCEQVFWHDKPFGSHVLPDSIDESSSDQIISPKSFVENYLAVRKPHIFRNMASQWPAYKLWTEEYLMDTYGELELRIEGKHEKSSKVPKGDVCLGRDTLKAFLNTYQNEDKYVVSELPLPMYKDVLLPSVLSCGQMLNKVVEVDIWINSDGGRGNGSTSKLHKDAFNTISCVLNGTKKWKLVDFKYNHLLYQQEEGPTQAGYGGFSRINVKRVDSIMFPEIGKIPEWQEATINPGDCIYLPSQWWHQVESFGSSNKAVAFLFSRFANEDESKRELINTENCLEKQPSISLDMVDVDLQYSGHGLLSMGGYELEELRKIALSMVDDILGCVTLKTIFKRIYVNHYHFAKNNDIRKKKVKEMYIYLLSLVGNENKELTKDFFQNKMTRAQLRHLNKWLFATEPSNTYQYEYSYIKPELIMQLLEDLERNDSLENALFLKAYVEMGGTLKFAKEIWLKLAGDRLVIKDYSAGLKSALKGYEYYRLVDKVDTELKYKDKFVKSDKKKNVFKDEL